MRRYYGLTEPYERKPRTPRRRPPKPEPSIVARHGSMLIFQVRDKRGRKMLRYVREAI